jgi:hemerythrin superfamily protein
LARPLALARGSQRHALTRHATTAQGGPWRAACTASAAEDPMNIYDALAKDHRAFEALLDRLVSASKADNDDWKSTLDELRRSVIAHAHAEEAVFYNALRDADKGKGIVIHSYKEHAVTETALRTLTAAKALDANWTSLMEKLSKDLRHHIKEEETKIFASARAVFSDEEAEQIGVAFERMKVETAKDGDSMVASTLDLIANLLPPRIARSFRQNMKKGDSSSQSHAQR